MKVINCNNAEKVTRMTSYLLIFPSRQGSYCHSYFIYGYTDKLKVENPGPSVVKFKLWITLLYCFKFLRFSCEFPMAITFKHSDYYRREVPPNLVWKWLLSDEVICNLLSGKKLTFPLKRVSNFLVSINETNSCSGNPVTYPLCWLRLNNLVTFNKLFLFVLSYKNALSSLSLPP